MKDITIIDTLKKRKNDEQKYISKGFFTLGIVEH